MGAYASVSDFVAYASWTVQDEAALEKILARAEDDVDFACGSWPVLASGRKFNPSALIAAQAAALKRAACAQAEFRIEMGEEHFAKAEHDYVSGPDWAVRGRLGYFAPRASQELAGHGLVRNWRTVSPPA